MSWQSRTVLGGSGVKGPPIIEIALMGIVVAIVALCLAYLAFYGLGGWR